MQLFELILAMAVFVLATLPVLTLFTREGRERRQGADHALALGLAVGAAEAVAAGAEDDPRGPAELAVKPALVAGWPVAEPAPALWRAMGRFRSQLASRATSEIVDFSLTLEWQAQGDERELTLAFAFPAARAATDPAAPVSDDAVRARLYPDERGTLAEVVARRGGALAAVRALGEVAERVLGIDAGEGDGPGEGGDTRVAFVRARRHEARAARRVVAMARLAALLPGIEWKSLGRAPEAARPVVERLGALAGELEAALAGALEEYGRVALARESPPRVRAGAFRRAVDAGVLLALTRRPQALAAVQDLLDRGITHGGDRAAWARLERAQANSLSALKAAYRAPARLEALATYDRVMIRARSDLLSVF